MLASETAICMAICAAQVLRTAQADLRSLVKIQQLLECSIEAPVRCVGIFLSDIGSSGKYSLLLVEAFTLSRAPAVRQSHTLHNDLRI